MLKRKICSTCKTGKISYELDSTSPVCPYMEFYWDKQCPFYEKDKEIGIFAKIKSISDRRLLK